MPRLGLPNPGMVPAHVAFVGQRSSCSVQQMRWLLHGLWDGPVAFNFKGSTMKNIRVEPTPKNIQMICHYWWVAIKHSVCHGHHVHVTNNYTHCDECVEWPGFGGAFFPRGMTRLTIQR